MRTIFPALGILLIFLGCKKSSDTHYYNLKVTVRDSYTNLPVDGVKVKLTNESNTPNTIPPLSDSSITNIEGNAFFTVSGDQNWITFTPSKDGYTVLYILNHALPLTEDLAVNIPIWRVSYLKLNLHKQGSYNSTDSVLVKVKGVLNKYYHESTLQDSFCFRQANRPDTLYNLSALYAYPSNTKICFQWDIIRNGSIFSSQTDSTDLIQYGTKNYNLNY